jgi:hypothetical protein
LVIGDSNSGDLINILTFADNRGNYSLSSLTIYDGCGNLYLPRHSFSHHIEQDRARECLSGEGLVSDNLLSDSSKSLIKQADIVFFASSWRDWEADLMSKSYKLLLADFGNKFYFLGNKHLEFSPENFIRTYGHTGFPGNAKAKPDKLELNLRLKEVTGSRFINPYELFCEKMTECMMKNQDGNLLIYDGFHLSKEGVRFFAIKLDGFFQTFKN